MIKEISEINYHWDDSPWLLLQLLLLLLLLGLREMEDWIPRIYKRGRNPRAREWVQGDIGLGPLVACSTELDKKPAQGGLISGLGAGSSGNLGRTRPIRPMNHQPHILSVTTSNTWRVSPSGSFSVVWATGPGFPL